MVQYRSARGLSVESPRAERYEHLCCAVCCRRLAPRQRARQAVGVGCYAASEESGKKLQLGPDGGSHPIGDSEAAPRGVEEVARRFCPGWSIQKAPPQPWRVGCVLRIVPQVPQAGLPKRRDFAGVEVESGQPDADPGLVDVSDTAGMMGGLAAVRCAVAWLVLRSRWPSGAARNATCGLCASGRCVYRRTGLSDTVAP